MTNEFFGSLQGPFNANEELITKIQEECSETIDYISKIGIHYFINYNLVDLTGVITPTPPTIVINNKEFQIGKTGVLEFEDTNITSIYFSENTSDSIYIDYLYKIV